MKKLLATIAIFFMCVSTSVMGSQTPSKDDIENTINKISYYQMNTVKNPAYGSVGGEWTVFGLARCGNIKDEYIEKYVGNVSKTVADNKGILSTRKYTEYARTIIALTAIQKNPQNFSGYNLLQPLATFENIMIQGVNGAAYTLMAFDCGNYEIPDATTGKQTTRNKLIDFLVKQQLNNGGWNYMGTEADVDVTAMVIQALAPYYNEKQNVKESIDKGLAILSTLQKSDGAYGNTSDSNCESTAQVLTALSEMRIKIDDSRFVKNGKTVYDGLMTFYKDNGAFCHMKGKGANQMSTDQAMYAITAYYRSISGMNRLYDMSDGIVKKDNTKEETTKSDNKEETKSSASDKNKNDANNNDKNNSTSKNTKKNALSNSKNNSKSNGNTLNNSDDTDNRENNESKNRKDNNIETEENTNTTDSLENDTDVLENNDEENKIATDNNKEETENKNSVNNKENVTKETKHKNRRPYIILIFGICCGIAGKFGYDIYKYKKKRVTNKDEQN